MEVACRDDQIFVWEDCRVVCRTVDLDFNYALGQKLMFSGVTEVLRDQFSFADKESARKYFLELRQLFIDRNYEKLDSCDYNALSDKITAKIAEGKQNNA